MKCRRILRANISGSSYVSGEQLLEALRALIKQEAFQDYVVYKKLIKDLDDGQYWSLGLRPTILWNNPSGILLFFGDDVDSEKSEFKLNYDRDSGSISVGNAVLDIIVPEHLDEEIIARVTEARDRLREILERR